MTKQEFKKLTDLASQWYAENMANYLKEYDWDKFVMVADYNAMFGSTRNRYDLYKNNVKITPYINEKGEYKSNETDSAKEIDEKYIQMGMSTVDLRTLTDDDTKYNIWEFTLYQSGRYESEFIWDNEAHLNYLEKDTKMWFTGYFEQIGYKIKDKCAQLGIEWDFDVKVVFSFTAGKANPVLFIAPNKPEIDFRLYLDQLWEYINGDYATAFEEWSKIRVEDTYKADIVLENEKTYHSMNYGELKDRFQRWNRATFIINKDIAVWNKLTFEDIKFEWLPENEA